MSDPREQARAAFLSLVSAMRGTPPAGRYYALTLTASEKGKVQYSWYSRFSGYSAGTPSYEMRAPSLVNPTKMLNLWASIGIPGVTVANAGHLSIYLKIGGSAVVERSLAKKAFSEIMAPIETAKVGPLGIPVTVQLAEPSTLQHAPTPKSRMEILKRDEFRCRVCGRRPADNVDIELQVHHIVPWAAGGLTLSPNLITLCHTCHKGLDPHCEWRLFELLSGSEPLELPKSGELQSKHRLGVDRYRQVVSSLEKRARAKLKRGMTAKPKKE